MGSAVTRMKPSAIWTGKCRFPIFQPASAASSAVGVAIWITVSGFCAIT